MAELVDALDSGSSGYPWGFESPQLHHIESVGLIPRKYWFQTFFCCFIDYFCIFLRQSRFDLMNFNYLLCLFYKRLENEMSR